MEREFETREAASIAAAKHIAECLTKRLDGAGEASLVVSGGTTPVQCFAALADISLPWASVHVLLSDERWVPATNCASNEKLVREKLVTNLASGAQFLPYFQTDTDATARCETLGEEILSLPFPFACSLLGMGEDGHFASLFPDAVNVQVGLDTDSSTLCVPITTAASEHARISLTLAALSRSDQVIVLVFGDRKREVLAAAAEPGSDLPVAKLLKQKRTPVAVYWAP